MKNSSYYSALGEARTCHLPHRITIAIGSLVIVTQYNLYKFQGTNTHSHTETDTHTNTHARTHTHTHTHKTENFSIQMLKGRHLRSNKNTILLLDPTI